MMIAVLEKKCGLKLAAQDVFLNVAGGLKVEDPGVDLAIIMALASSYFDSAITENICFAAEVGLSGELRPVRQVESRVKEAHKLGFKTVYLASLDEEKLGSDLKTKIKVLGHENISTLMKTFFV